MHGTSVEAHDRTRTKSDARLDGILLLLPAAVFLAFASGVYRFAIDDTYISLRYAANLARGDGLVFNPGDAPLEGFTNMLLVLIEAGILKTGLPAVGTTKVLIVACVALFLVAFTRWAAHRFAAERLPRAGLLAATAGVLVATSSPLVLWSVSGMETGLFVALTGAALMQHLRWAEGEVRGRGTVPIDLIFLLACLTRPEGLLFWAGAIVHALLVLRGRPQASRARWISLGIGLAALLAYAGFKLSYFGALLPATSTAKIGASSWASWSGGLTRAVAFLRLDGNWVVTAFVGAGVASALRQRRPIDHPVYLLSGLALAYLVYAVRLGPRVAMDDAFRYYVPVLPLAALLLVESTGLLGQLLRDHRRAAWGVALAGMLLLPVLRAYELSVAWRRDLNWGSVSYVVAARDIAEGLERGHASVGRFLAAYAPPDAKLVLHDAGAIPWFSGLRVIDTWSLVDPVLVPLRSAHRRATTPEERAALRSRILAHVMSQNPEFIVQDDLRFLDDPDVRARYVPLRLWTYLRGYFIRPWVRADLAPTLPPDAFAEWLTPTAATPAD